MDSIDESNSEDDKNQDLSSPNLELIKEESK